MPFKSEKQRAFMYAKHPETAKRWAKKYGAEIVSKAVDKEKKKHGN